jgi:hypothetical protein
LNFHESSRQLGSIRAVELALFRILGERAPHLVPAGCAVWAAWASRAHAWRASLLEELLPISVGLAGLDELTVLPGGAIGDELARSLSKSSDGAAAGALPGDESRDRRADSGPPLVEDVSGRLYPLLIDEYARYLDKCEPAADGAAMRAVGRALADLEAVRAAGAALCAPR